MKRELEQERIERLRGWILYLLYKARPHPLEVCALMKLLDKRNFPLSRHRIAEELDYLRGLDLPSTEERLIRVFTSGETRDLDPVAQSKLIQHFSETDSDEEMGSVLCVRLTAQGINFQQAVIEVAGIQRVY